MARNPWLRLGLNTWALGMEASQMIALRTLKILSGGSAGQAEARRKIDEMIQAGLDLQSAALTGSLGPTAEGAAGKCPTIGGKCVQPASPHKGMMFDPLAK